MIKRLFILIALTAFAKTSAQDASYPLSAEQDKEGVMSEAYWNLWNPEVQAGIDRDIDAYRKADAQISVPGLKKGTEVKIQQISSDFIFGAHIFNFDQLGSKEYNDRYKELYGTLFNSATIAFYWKAFETEPGRLRFVEEYWDTEDWWNNCENPKAQTHWRRPCTDKVVAYCKSRGIRLHGHTIIWGNRQWQHPQWLFGMVPQNEKEAFNSLCMNPDLYKTVPLDTLDARLPEFAAIYADQFKKRIERLAQRYNGTIDSWDVVNESATDYQKEGSLLMKSSYGLMPADYTFKAFSTAQSVMPESTKLNINDYFCNRAYVDQIASLRARGCRIDIMGSQMHLFDPKQCLDIADGSENMSPDFLTKRFELLSEAGLPIHLSEITITAPGGDLRGEKIQAVIARNLYRKWFSIKNMMGITWWNVVDDCGAPGEPSVSGLFHRDMTPKLSYYALRQLILEEFRTNITVQAEKGGTISFRGFRGNYKLSWSDKEGEHEIEYHLK